MTDYNDLIIKFLNESASDNEVEQLKTWVNQSEKNKNEFLEMKIAWLASARNQNIKAEELDTAFDTLINKINKKSKLKFKDSSYSLGKLIRIAAGFLLIFAMGSMAAYLIMKTSFSVEPAMTDEKMYIYTPKGSRVKTILQDGTTVWLNAGSNLMYNTNSFNKEDRQVTLIGEGFFQVAENHKKPFIVNAKNFKIVALGTAFNVKAYPDEDLVETTLVEGLVKIDGEQEDKQAFSITLRPNQHIALPAGKALIKDIPLTDPEKFEAEDLNKIVFAEIPIAVSHKPTLSNVMETELFTSWKDEKWIIKGENLGDLAIMLERRHNISIGFSTEELKKYRFTGTFQNETVEQVMQVLKLTAPLQYRIDKGMVTLNLDASLKKKYEKYLNHN